MPEPEMNDGQKKGLCKKWLTAIEDSLTREKTYRKKAQKVVDLYEAKKAESQSSL